MNTAKRLTGVLNSSKEINFNDNSKIIIMSDCHRGNSGVGDNFNKNRNLFLAALRYYYRRNYTYIELGDGDELWENNSLKDIISAHNDAFAEMAKFYAKGHFYMIYGNHDIEKREIRGSFWNEYYDEQSKKMKPLFPDIDIPEGLILVHEDTGNKILLTHGHQGDFLNDNIWPVAKLLVRYLWGPLELIGVRNPTSVATNDRKKSKIEKKLIYWTQDNHQMLIAGHTHRQVFPRVGKHLYFNDGCCTNPFYITGIEIHNGTISLVKWSIKTREDRTLYIDREIINGPIKLSSYFKSSKNLKCDIKKDC